jgi:hypothetical protein
LKVPYFLGNVWQTKREELDWKSYQVASKKIADRLQKSFGFKNQYK